MAAILIERIEVIILPVTKARDGVSFGKLVDEVLAQHVLDGNRVQRVAIDLDEADWNAVALANEGWRGEGGIPEGRTTDGMPISNKPKIKFK